MSVILGQFYPTGSFIEELDAGAKILCTILYIIAVFLCSNAITYTLITVFFVAVLLWSKLPIRLLFKGMKGMIFILIFTGVMNIFFVEGGTVIFKLGFLKITTEGALATLKITLRLFLLIMFSSILTLTTKPVRLSVALEKMLKPLGKIGLPYQDISMMMSIALRFIPTLADELDKIKKAQMARGVSFDEGNIVNRIKALVPVIIPLFVASFKRADELALAMEARCYTGGNKRTRLNNPTLGRADYGAVLVVVVLIVIVVALGYF